MSYDLILFRPREGIDPRDIATADDEIIQRGARNPLAEAMKRKIADALLAHDRQLDIFAPDFDEIAKLHKLPVEEAYERFRQIEINDTASSGVQIALYDEHASITVPFWHKCAAARDVFERLWVLIEIACREGEFEVFDPQLDQTITAQSFNAVLERYARVTARMDDVLGRSPRRPWWKLW